MINDSELADFLRDRAAGTITGSVVEIPAADIANSISAEGEGVFTEAEIAKIRAAFDLAGLAAEPDISNCYRKVPFSESFFVYRANQRVGNRPKWLLQEKVLFSLMALIAKSNGAIDGSEVNFIKKRCEIRSKEGRFSEVQLLAIAYHALCKPPQELKKVLGLLRKYFPRPEAILETAKDIIIVDHDIDRGEVNCFIHVHSLYYEFPLSFYQAKKLLRERAREMFISLGGDRKEEHFEESIQENLDDLFEQNDVDDLVGELLESF